MRVVDDDEVAGGVRGVGGARKPEDLEAVL
jgi:hypothetical protein